MVKLGQALQESSSINPPILVAYAFEQLVEVRTPNFEVYESTCGFGILIEQSD